MAEDEDDFFHRPENEEEKKLLKNVFLLYLRKIINEIQKNAKDSGTL